MKHQSREEGKQQLRKNSFDSSSKTFNMVKDYECRSIVNKMLEVNQISVEKPRGLVNVQSEIKRRDNYRHDTIENFEKMPFNRAIDVDDPYLSSLTFD
jgi:hypothetical protein